MTVALCCPWRPRLFVHCSFSGSWSARWSRSIPDPVFVSRVLDEGRRVDVWDARDWFWCEELNIEPRHRSIGIGWGGWHRRGPDPLGHLFSLTRHTPGTSGKR